MKFLLMLTIVLFGFNCTHDVKPTDPVVTPPAPTVDPVPTPTPEVTKEKTIIVYFHFDKSKLTSAQKKIIKEEVSARKEGTQVLIIGYTDSQGSDKYNQKLSAKRAKAISKYLDSLKIANSWMAKGETELMNADKTKAEHKLNRRATVAFTVIVK